MKEEDKHLWDIDLEVDQVSLEDLKLDCNLEDIKFDCTLPKNIGLYFIVTEDLLKLIRDVQSIPGAATKKPEDILEMLMEKWNAEDMEESK